MKKLIAGALAALTLATTLATPASAYDEWRRRPSHHHRDGGDVAGAAALGIVGGMILGGLAAQAAQPSYVYDDEPVVVRRRPVRVYEEEPVVRRSRRPVCETLIKYDMYGRPYEYRDCAP